jgi:N-acetylglucosaminyl-diphospho-decaprenol L-rhamnosyltransferase
MTPKKVQAVVLNYKTPNVAIQCVESLLKQTGIDLQIVIVDNNSCDGSGELFLRRFQHNRNVSFVQSYTNGGYAAGNNLGLMTGASTNYYAVVNSDVVLLDDNSLFGLIQVMEQHAKAIIGSPRVESNCTGIQGPYLPVSYVGYIINRIFPFFFRTTDTQAQQSSHELYVHRGIGAFFVAKAQCFKDVGFFDPKTFLEFEEEILVTRLKGYFKSDKIWLYVPYLKVTHNDAQSSRDFTKSRRWSPHGLNSAIYYFQEYHGAGRLKCTGIIIAEYFRRIFWSLIINQYRNQRKTPR